MAAKKTAKTPTKDEQQINTYRDMLNCQTTCDFEEQERNDGNKMVVDAPPEHKDRTLAEGDRFALFLQEACLRHLVVGLNQGRRPMLQLLLRDRESYGRDQSNEWIQDDDSMDMDDGDIYDIRVEAMWDSNAGHQYNLGSTYFAASTYEQRNAIRSIISHTTCMFLTSMRVRRMESIMTEQQLELESHRNGHTAIHGGIGCVPGSRSRICKSYKLER